MNHTETDYINAGAAYERASNTDKARAVAQRLRAMISSERPENQKYARTLIEKGRAKAQRAELALVSILIAVIAALLAVLLAL